MPPLVRLLVTYLCKELKLPFKWMFRSIAQKAYVGAEVPFLMDQLDTVLAYEQRGVDELLGQHPLMALTDSMDHVQQLETIYGEYRVHRCGAGDIYPYWTFPCKCRLWKRQSVETNSTRVLLSGFKALTTSVTGFLDQCAADGKVRNASSGLIRHF